MKLLLFSDLHADLAAARDVVRRAATADVVVGAGDFGHVRTRLRECIDVLRGINRPTVLVAGNNESTEELRAACGDRWPSARVLHGEAATIHGVTFFGLGGGVPVTPFGAWSYDLDETHAAKLLEPCPTGCVLVSHSPPKGAVDVSSAGNSIGSTAVREAIERCRPRLVVCGHVHASAGHRATVGQALVINAGPHAVEWES